MYKLKSKKTILKRFKVTGSGKVIRSRQAIRHKHVYKTKRRIRTFREPVILSTRQANAIKRMI